MRKLAVDPKGESKVAIMTPQDESITNENERFLNAIGYVFEILGPVCRQRLCEYLKWKYDIVEEATQSDLASMQKAISEIFGDDAAQLIMKQIYAAMDRSDSYAI